MNRAIPQGASGAVGSDLGTPMAQRDTALVAVAVLTYRRPAGLAAVLPELLAQGAELAPPAPVLVIDNDPAGSAREAVNEITGPNGQAHYLHEAEPGIAAARNRALVAAAELGAAAVVFIDDDEQPEPGWLAALVKMWRTTGADAISGPVLARYPDSMDQWLVAGRFFDRRRLDSGTSLRGAATNNLLLDLNTLTRLGLRFDADFGITGGSDTMLTYTLTRAGGRILWCDEALVSEDVPDSRMSRQWVLRRAFRTGNVWGRVALRLAQEAPRRPGPLERAELLARAGKRSGRGVVRVGLGSLRRDPAEQAQGCGDVAAGLGLAASVTGYVYSEYRRR